MFVNWLHKLLFGVVLCSMRSAFQRKMITLRKLCPVVMRWWCLASSAIGALLGQKMLERCLFRVILLEWFATWMILLVATAYRMILLVATAYRKLCVCCSNCSQTFALQPRHTDSFVSLAVIALYEQKMPRWLVRHAPSLSSFWVCAIWDVLNVHDDMHNLHGFSSILRSTQINFFIMIYDFAIRRYDLRTQVDSAVHVVLCSRQTLQFFHEFRSCVHAAVYECFRWESDKRAVCWVMQVRPALCDLTKLRGFDQISIVIMPYWTNFLQWHANRSSKICIMKMKERFETCVWVYLDLFGRAWSEIDDTRRSVSDDMMFDITDFSKRICKIIWPTHHSLRRNLVMKVQEYCIDVVLMRNDMNCFRRKSPAWQYFAHLLEFEGKHSRRRW